MNTNCLEGVACPKCKYEDRFLIVGTSTFTVTDAGTENHSDIEWDDDSSCTCPECGFSGKLGEFRAPATDA
jgi:hypothetical protein